jgi:hypothetical protein
MLVDEGLAALVKDAEVQAAGVQGNPAVVPTLLGVANSSRPPTAYRVGSRKVASNQYPRASWLVRATVIQP